MRRIIFLLLAIIAILMPDVTCAQENTSSLTVNDGGTNTTDCGVPLWGPEANSDIYIQECEYIIPAESLTAMKYHKICGMTYYLSTCSFDYFGNEQLEVYLMTVDQASFDNGLITVDDDKLVYSGNIVDNGQEMQIDFYNQPFTYTGGNLLIYTKLNSNSYKWFSFYGVNSPGSAICNYTYYDSPGETVVKNSLPKVTFTFENDVVGMPVPYDLLVSDVTSKSATLSWESNSEINKWDLAYRKDANQYTFDNDEEGWSKIVYNGNGNCWVWNNQYMRSDYTNYSLATDNNYLVSPEVTLGGSIDFKARGGSKDYFEIYVSIGDNQDVNDYTRIYESSPINNSNWLPFKVDLSSFNGQKGHVVIRHPFISKSVFLDIDDISITEPWTIVSNVSDNAYTLNNLEQDTHYTVKTRSVYGQSSGEWSESVDFETKAAINISSAGWATFCWNEPLDFSSNEDLKVYCIGSLDDSENGIRVKLTNITLVPENIGVLIKGNAGQYEIPGIATSTDPVTESGDNYAFVGVNTPTEINPTDGEFTNFILAMVDGSVGFYKVGSTGILAAHKAYLKISDYSLADVISFVVDEEDSISNVMESRPTESIWFTIGGVRIHDPKQSGLYIRNGEKVVVK